MTTDDDHDDDDATETEEERAERMRDRQEAAMTERWEQQWATT